MLAVLVWAPLPFASARVWGWMLLTGLLFLLFSGWCLLWAAGQARLAAPVWRTARWPLLCLALVQAWVACQLLPLPQAWLAALSPTAAHWWSPEAAAPLSLDPGVSRLYLLRGVSLALAFFLTIALVNSRRRLRALLYALLVSGTFQGAYGALMVLTGVEYGFFIPKYVGEGVATGTFVNRNHLAGYLVMCLAAGTGLLLAQLDKRAAPRGWREAARRWLALLLSSKFQVRVCLAIMVVALVLTRSRMGNVAFFSSLGIAGALALIAEGRFSRRGATFLASLILVDLLILGHWFGLDQVVARLEQSSPVTEGRVSYLEPLLAYLGHFPLTGSGGGSFYGVFPNFMPPGTVAQPAHAHNDYLQFAVELGLPALSLLLVPALCAWQAWRALAAQRSRLLRGAAFTVLMTASWALLHSAVDFNLQIPANSLTFVVLLALGPIARRLPGERRKASSGGP